ncbi:unnamed protein product [Acidithrix sp. C25]|nr:unnamed protein product [Acidithrix sp. C25]
MLKKSHLGSLASLSVSALVLSACGSFANSVTVPVASSAKPLLSDSALTNGAVVSPNQMWVTAKSLTYWELFLWSNTTKSAKMISPVGISGEGGLAIAYDPGKYGVIGFYPYQSMLHSPLIVTKDGGYHWNSSSFGGSLAPVKDAIGLSDSTIFLVATTSNGRILEEAPSSAAGAFRTLPFPVAGQIDGIAGISNGVVAQYSSGGTYHLAIYSSQSGQWSMSTITSPNPISMSSAPVKTSGVSSTEEVSICSSRGSSLTLGLVSPTGVITSSVVGSPNSQAVPVACTVDSNNLPQALLRGSGGKMAAVTSSGATTKLGSSLIGAGAFVQLQSHSLVLAPFNNGVHMIDLQSGIDFGGPVDTILSKIASSFG